MTPLAVFFLFRITLTSLTICSLSCLCEECYWNIDGDSLPLYMMSSCVAISTVLVVIVRQAQMCQGAHVEGKGNLVEFVSPSTSGD